MEGHSQLGEPYASRHSAKASKQKQKDTRGMIERRGRRELGGGRRVSARGDESGSGTKERGEDRRVRWVGERNARVWRAAAGCWLDCSARRRTERERECVSAEPESLHGSEGCCSHRGHAARKFERRISPDGEPPLRGFRASRGSRIRRSEARYNGSS